MAYKRLFNEEKYLEMANIPEKTTGIKGYFQIRNEKPHPKLAHVHFMYNLTKKNEYAKFTIAKNENDIKLLLDKQGLSSKEIKQIKKFISLNAELLEKYYFQGIIMDTVEFLDSLKKVK